MSQTADQHKRKQEEQRALEEYVKEHPGSTLLKDERTAKYIEREQLKVQRAALATKAEMEAHASREEKYGNADWAHFPELKGTKLSIPLRLPSRPSAQLWDSLGQFVNLTAKGLGDFQYRYPKFLPAWFYTLPCGNDGELLAWPAWQARLREAWHSGFHSEYVAQLVNIPIAPGNKQFEFQPVCDAQRAVLAMALESWRARFCPKCGVPFVARKSRETYWPKQCFAEHRREKQRASKRRRARKRTKFLGRTKR